MSYRCRKCTHLEFKSGELRGAGGMLSSLFDISTERFSYVACARCGYTEFYNVPLSDLSKVTDFFVG